jgi:small conductance mechanosensitive channel
MDEEQQPAGAPVSETPPPAVEEMREEAAMDAATDPGVDLSPEGMQRLWEDNSDLLISYAASALGALVFLIVAFVVAGWIKRLVSGGLARAKVDETVARFLGTIARWAVVILAIIAALGMFGVQTTSFAAVIGAAGLAIALSFQGALGNLAAGLMLLLFRPFKVGDVVNIAGQTGKITEIDLTTTILDTFDNRRFIIPNGDVYSSVIENISHHPERRCDISVGVEYSADIDQTREVLVAAADNTPGRLQNRDTQVVLQNLGASSVDWQVRIWATADDFWPMKEAAIREIKTRLDAAGIGIPFPQMDVHVDGRLQRE